MQWSRTRRISLGSGGDSDWGGTDRSEHFHAGGDASHSAGLWCIPGGVAVLALGAQGLKTVFGRPVQNPPFLLGRVIADGPGLAYLQEHCKKTAYVSCELTNAQIKSTESFMWAFIGSVPFSPRFDPDRRERFYAEQWEIVAATIGRDPLRQIAASLQNAAKQLVYFEVGPDMIKALARTLRESSRQGSVTASITSNVEVCQANRGAHCYRVFGGGMLTLLHVWHNVVVACSGFSSLFVWRRYLCFENDVAYSSPSRPLPYSQVSSSLQMLSSVESLPVPTLGIKRG